MFWTGFALSLLMFLGIITYGYRLVLRRIFDGAMAENFGSLFGRLLLSLLFTLSPLVLLPQIFGHYSTANIHSAGSVWFAVFSLVCITASAARVAHFKDLYQTRVKRTLRHRDSEHPRSRRQAVLGLIGCLLILGFCGPITSGLIKNTLYENGILSYEFDPKLADALNNLRLWRAGPLSEERASCVQLRNDLMLASHNTNFLEGASTYTLQSGTLATRTHAATGPDDITYSEFTYERKGKPRCTGMISDSVAVRLAAGRQIEVRTIVAAVDTTIRHLREIEQSAPLGLPAGALLGYSELLNATKLGTYEARPIGRTSVAIDWLIFATLVAITALAFLFMKGKDSSGSN